MNRTTACADDSLGHDATPRPEPPTPRKTGKKGEGGGARRMKRPPQRQAVRLKSIAEATRTGQDETAPFGGCRHKGDTGKTRPRASYVVAATLKPAKTRLMPKPPSFKPKPLRVTTPAKSASMTPRPLPRSAVPRLQPPAAIRWRIVRLSEPLPDAAFKEAKAQLRVMRRAAQTLRKADRAEERTVKELVRHAAHDLFERQRQAGEANREQRRQQWEQDRAEATRPAPPTRATGQPPQL